MNSLTKRKIGIMGGTFDPIHYGHLLIAQSALEEFQLEKVIFLPTGKAPHKSQIQVTDADIRCEMVSLAISDNLKFDISSLEAKNPNTNYTYQTLQKLNSHYPNTQFYFIMGEDSLDDFSTWKHPEEICKSASILVAVRNDAGNSIEEKISNANRIYAADMHMLHAPNFSISSHEIRNRIKNKKSIQYMTPNAVEAYIREHFLYL